MPNEVGSPVARCPKGVGVLEVEVERDPKVGDGFQNVVVIEKLAAPHQGISFGAFVGCESPHSVELLPPGQYRVTVQVPKAKGYQFDPSDVLTVEVKEKASAKAKLKVRPGGIIRLRFVRGLGVRSGSVKVKVLDRSGAELRTFDGVALVGGLLRVELPAEDAPKAAKLQVVFTEPVGTTTGEGYAVTLAEPPKLGKAEPLSRTLRQLGLWRDEPAAASLKFDDEKMDAVKLQFATARLEKIESLAVLPPDDAVAEALLAKYVEYAAKVERLAAITFVDAVDEPAREVRLQLVRGRAAYSGKVKAVVVDASGEELATHASLDVDASGLVRIAIAKELVARAAKARVYFLDASGKETGDGLVATFVDGRDEKDASTASRLLRALGLWRDEPLASGTKLQRGTGPALDEAKDVPALKVDLALGALARTRGETPKSWTEADGDALVQLAKAYARYGATPYKLPTIEFRD